MDTLTNLSAQIIILEAKIEKIKHQEKEAIYKYTRTIVKKLEWEINTEIIDKLCAVRLSWSLKTVLNVDEAELLNKNTQVLRRNGEGMLYQRLANGDIISGSGYQVIKFDHHFNDLGNKCTDEQWDLLTSGKVEEAFEIIKQKIT